MFTLITKFKKVVDVSINNISKTYEEVVALDQVSFKVNKGEIFGLIGPDGAGKSTLFKIISTLILPDSGTVTIDNLDTKKDYKKIRQILGYMPQTFSLYMDLTVEENLNFFADVFNVKVEQNYYLIKDIFKQLADFKSFTAASLSGGMKQKLALSCALIHKPKLLLLDEPTFGVDPISRFDFWQNLKQLKEKFGLTIIVSTAYMDEAELCDRIAFLHKGRLMTIETPSQIIEDYDKHLYSIASEKMNDLIIDLKNFNNKIQSYTFGNSVHLVSNSQVKEQIEDFLSKKGHKSIKIEEIKPTIEDCFIDLTF